MRQRRTTLGPDGQGKEKSLRLEESATRGSATQGWCQKGVCPQPQPHPERGRGHTGRSYAGPPTVGGVSVRRIRTEKSQSTAVVADEPVKTSLRVWFASLTAVVAMGAVAFKA